ncbi:hypothetical protein NEIFL0001_1134 [Neisseria flavescens SK114]|jgi:hypothetical protein|nr:hypothetical protein NEIFL0001_1134 [Neisseria flavescens SK114]
MVSLISKPNIQISRQLLVLLMPYSEGRLKDCLSFSDGLFSILKTTSAYMLCHLMFIKNRTASSCYAWQTI